MHGLWEWCNCGGIGDDDDGEHALEVDSEDDRDLHSVEVDEREGATTDELLIRCSEESMMNWKDETIEWAEVGEI